MPDRVSPEARSRIMRSIRSTDTGPECLVRSAVHRRGYRFRKHVRSLPGAPDVVFASARVVVFIDGDFWHGYRFTRWKHKLTEPWREKIIRNMARDRRNHAALRRRGWTVLRVWEHEVKADLERVVSRIDRAVAAARQRARTN